MLSPAERNAVAPGAAAARSFSMVPAKNTVLESMRPWKSLMPRKFSSTLAGVTGRFSPTTTGSWSLARNWSGA